jgi:3-phosphoshikimate 1-carboxyvinyltransferase
MREAVVKPIAAPDASVRPPGSRSLTNRALVCAAAAEGTSRLTGWLDSDDTRAMIEGLGRLGVETQVEPHSRDLLVHGVGTHFAIPLHPIDCRASGTTLRFLTALASLVPGRVVLDGTARMRERPIQELADALGSLGVAARTTAGCPPVTVQGGALAGGEVAIDSGRSSQFLSALLLVAPLARNDVKVTATAIASRPYVDMTLEVMSAFGASVDMPGENSFWVRGGQRYRPRTYPIEPDASAATYFMAAAAVTGGRVRIEGLSAASSQADVRFIEVLGRMGCAVERGPNWIAVRGPRYLHGVDVDLNAFPDSAQTLAVIALFARGPTAIRNVPHLRLKETDRMAALKSELEKLGASVELTATDILITPPERLVPGRIATYADHRMAMSFALAGLVVDGIVIEDPDCVSKTFPDFFTRLAALGR